MSAVALRPEYVALLQRARNFPTLQLIPHPDPELAKKEILGRTPLTGAEIQTARLAYEAVRTPGPWDVPPADVTPKAPTAPEAEEARLAYEEAVGRLQHEEAVAKLAVMDKPKTFLQQSAYTDLGNTDYFVEHHGNEFRFDHSRGRWLIWSEHRWGPDLKNRVANTVQSDAAIRLREAVDMKVDPDDEGAVKHRESVIKWALASQHRSRIDNVLQLAKSRWRISVATASGWDADPWLLGVPNGVVDLRRGTLRPGKRDDQITKHAGARFDPDAKAPRWDQFVREVLNEDEEVVTFVRRAIGYTLSGAVSEDCWFGCQGSGRNGKSTLFKALHAVLGDYSYVASFSLVTRGYGSESKKDYDIAYLQNCRFVMASETKEGGVWDEERLKRLTGRDPLHGEYKYGAEFNFMPTHKLWFMFNHQPSVSCVSCAQAARGIRPRFALLSRECLTFPATQAVAK